jgi:hypothetical protein
MEWLFYLDVMRYQILTFAILVCLSSCVRGDKQLEDKRLDLTYVPIKPKGMMDQISLADSAACIYYDKPSNPRFFKVTKIKDMGLLKTLIVDINSGSISGAETCQTLGKWYFYGKGDIVDVVYFSTEDSCMSFSFIKNGEKYFSRMGMESQRIIDSLQQHALAPQPVR